MKIFIAQINPIVGDIQGNCAKILDFCSKAKVSGANLVIFPELSLIGYPPKDLILKPSLYAAQEKALESIAKASSVNFGIIVGGISLNKYFGRKFFNSLYCFVEGRIDCIASKTLLPSYDVFDEVRYFEQAKESTIWEFMGYKLGLSICEDIWTEKLPSLYSKNPISELVSKDAQVIINCSASPYAFEKNQTREEILQKTAQQYKRAVIYINQIGANDELIFDGASLVYNSQGVLIKKLKTFIEDSASFDIDEALQDSNGPIEKKSSAENCFAILDQINVHNASEIETAIILGLKDYVHKSKFSKVVLGLSGGIDSALVAYFAAKALGKNNVYAYMLPSEFTSESSLKDATELANNLGINYQIVNMKEVHNQYRKLIPNSEGIVDENLQPRIRACILMAFANSANALLLATSNKSELAVGYSTLYGDSCGALAIIGDLLKTTIYKLCEHINSNGIIIPVNILNKAPTAELRHNQKDTDSLPDYEILDRIILLYVQELKSQKEIVDLGYDPTIVKKTLNLIDRAEYKRKQAPPILKIANTAFGIGRRMPIVQGFINE